MSTVHNARVQLLANLLNTMAGTSFAIGVAAPIAAGIFYGHGLSVGAVLVGAVVWFVLMIVLHGAAQSVIGGLRND